MAFNQLHAIWFAKDSNGDLVSNPVLPLSVLNAKGTLTLSVNGEHAGSVSVTVAGSTGATSTGSIIIEFTDNSENSPRQIIIERSKFGTGINRINAFDINDIGPIEFTFWDGYEHQSFKFFRTTAGNGVS